MNPILKILSVHHQVNVLLQISLRKRCVTLSILGGRYIDSPVKLWALVYVCATLQ